MRHSSRLVVTTIDSPYVSLADQRQHASRTDSHFLTILADRSKPRFHATIRPPGKQRFSEEGHDLLLDFFQKNSSEHRFLRNGNEFWLKDLHTSCIEEFISLVDRIADLENQRYEQLVRSLPRIKDQADQQLASWLKNSCSEPNILSATNFIYLVLIRHWFRESSYSPIVVRRFTTKSAADFEFDSPNLFPERKFAASATLDWMSKNYESVPIDLIGLDPDGLIASIDEAERDTLWSRLHSSYPFAQGLLGFSQLGFNGDRSVAIVEATNIVDSELLSPTNALASTDFIHGLFLLKLNESCWSILDEIRISDWFWDGQVSLDE